MTSITHWDPFSDLRRTMGGVFEPGFARPWQFLPSTHSTGTGSFPVEIWENDNAVELKAALPGVRPEDVDITVDSGVLNIKADRKPDEGVAGTHYYRREIDYGTWHRSFSLPIAVDSERAEARFEHGMLYLTLPKSEYARPRQIKIANVDAENAHMLN